MSDDPTITLEALEREEARLRERLAKIALVKNLLGELGLQAASTSHSQANEQTDHTDKPKEPDAPIVRPSVFDGTFEGLVLSYRQDERSNYLKLKQKVRLNYDNAFNRLIADVGSERMADWNAARAKDVYEQKWAAGGKIAMGRSMVAKLRLLCSYGSTVLDDDGCTLLSAILSNMRVPVAKTALNEGLSREQARAIRIAAREYFGWDSIAMAQAFQFEIPKLRQLDVIGEWVPLSEGPDSLILKGDEKWVHGLQWSDIDENLVLKKTITSGRRNEKKEISFSLNRCQMVREEINRVPEDRRKGPMVICEFNGLPWSQNEFRRKWRIVADKAGIPKNVKNMDSRKEAQPPDE